MTTSELWQAVLGEMELSISKASFTTWFKNTQVNTLSDEEVVVSVPNIFAKEWLEKKYKKGILDSVRKHFPKINRLSCVVGQLSSDESGGKSVDSVVTTGEGKTVDLKNNPNSPVASSAFPKTNNGYNNLNSRYNFDTFVVGKNNELAFAACQSISADPGNNYNPLFIYGGVGLGKTHLLQSTGNLLFLNNPSVKIRYLSMERFANELVSAIQNNKAKEFKNNYIELDVLILDDIQFLTGREKTQEEFFHVFESLYQMGKQIILSSDRMPKSIPALEDRLRSRFEGGMIADVGKPDYETRIAIIKRKLAEKNFRLKDSIIDYLAENIHHNVRELEGALNKIIATYQLRGGKPEIKEVIDLTKDVISASRQKDITAEKIVKTVADYFNIKPEEISGRCRKKKVVKPRQLAVYLLRNEISLSYPEIGETLGGRDHSTAIYAYEKVKKELASSDVMADQVKFIREKFVDY